MVGVGGGFWLFSKWNIEIKEVFLNSHKKTGTHGTQWHKRIRAVLKQWTAFSLTGISLLNLLRHEWLLMHQCLPVRISDTNEWLAVFSLLVYKLYLSDGFLQDPYWAWTEISAWTIYFLSTLKIKPLPLIPAGSYSVWPSNAWAGLLQQCHGTERLATSHTLKGLNS